MGLFVVGSLAKRHGIAVRLRRNGDDKQGVTVSVHLPAGLLADSSPGRAPGPARPLPPPGGAAPAALAAPPTSAVGGTTKAGLPTRVRGASGATRARCRAPAKKVLPTRTPGAHGPTAANAIQTPRQARHRRCRRAVEDEGAPPTATPPTDKVASTARSDTTPAP